MRWTRGSRQRAERRCPDPNEHLSYRRLTNTGARNCFIRGHDFTVGEPVPGTPDFLKNIATRTSMSGFIFHAVGILNRNRKVTKTAKSSHPTEAQFRNRHGCLVRRHTIVFGLQSVHLGTDANIPSRVSASRFFSPPPTCRFRW